MIKNVLEKVETLRSAIREKEDELKHTKLLHDKHHHHEHSNTLANPEHHGSPREIVTDGKYSEGTKLVNHSQYGKARFKPAHDLFDERDNPNAMAHSTAHRELAFHDLMHDHFNLGEHMHHVGLIYHDKKLRSVHENLESHHTLAHAIGANNKIDNKHKFHPRDSLQREHRNGTLHKLAMVDYMTGNTDRHFNNAMVHKSGRGKPIQMIDHGLAFPPTHHFLESRPSKTGYHIPLAERERVTQKPSYLSFHDKNKANTQHKKVGEWLKNVDENKVQEFLKKKGFQEKVHRGVHHRIRNAKAAMNKYNNMKDVTSSLFNNEHHIPQPEE